MENRTVGPCRDRLVGTDSSRKAKGQSDSEAAIKDVAVPHRRFAPRRTRSAVSRKAPQGVRANQSESRNELMSISRHHNDWLRLVPNSGPFLSLPGLRRRFPQGLDAHDASKLVGCGLRSMNGRQPVRASARSGHSPDVGQVRVGRDAGLRRTACRGAGYSAVADATTGYASWYANLWLEEPVTLRAFRTVLGGDRLFSVPDDDA